MNWFERYGIVGMFFIVMTGMWFFCLFPEARGLFNNSNPELLKFIGGFCGLSFLPFGYIIMICEQVRYYKMSKKNRQIHCRYWNDLPKELKTRIQELEKEKKLDVFNETCEAQLEPILTYYDRTKIDSCDKNKFLSEFATRRWDTIAINGGLFLALIFSFFVAICIRWAILDITIKWNAFSIWFVIIFALLIGIVLCSSNRILENQIFEVGRRKLRDIQLEE